MSSPTRLPNADGMILMSDFYMFLIIDWTIVRSFKSCVHVPLMLGLVKKKSEKESTLCSGNEGNLVSFGLVLSCGIFF